MKTYEKTLKNGLRVILVGSEAFPSLSTLLLVGAGSRYENKKNNGIAHFFEHMAFKGSKKYPSSFLLASTIESLGATSNAFTSKDYTGYWIKAPAKHFEPVVDVIADMIQNPLLDTEEIEREKGVIAEEINMYEDTPARKVGELFENLLYKGNPLGYDIAGTKEIVRTFDQTTFSNYMKSLYHPSNAILVVAGGIDGKAKKFMEIIDGKFNQWKNGKKSSFIKIKEAQTKPQALVHYKKTEQAHFCLGFRTFSFHDERRHALVVLAAILGKGMSSRLFVKVREREGLCYYITTYTDSFADAGNILTHAGVSVDAEKVKKAIKITLEEHAQVRDGKLTVEELHRAKEMLKGNFILSLEDTFNVANFYGRKVLLENDMDSPEDLLKKIEAVTISDVVSVAKDVFTPDRLNLALIGPFKKAKEFEEILKL